MGAAGALIANVVFGRLSDRTTSKLGRRRPWIVGGTLGMSLGLIIMALAPNVAMTAGGWFIAQLGANATLAPFIATISDQVPKFQRGGVSALLGMAQNVGILGGTWVAELFQSNMFVMLVVPSFVAIAAMLFFAFVLKDQVLPAKPPSMTLKEWAQTFWVSPLKYPDYAFAWWSRFLITMASFMFSTYRFFFLNRQVGVPEENVAGVITTSVLIYTVCLVVTAWFAGKLSDKLQRRKIFVILSTVLYAVGTVMLAHTHSVDMFYLVEAVLGIAYGVYIGVDLALVVDVLPNPDDAGKDLGVFNIANALPQTLSPILADPRRLHRRLDGGDGRRPRSRELSTVAVYRRRSSTHRRSGDHTHQESQVAPGRGGTTFGYVVPPLPCARSPAAPSGHLNSSRARAASATASRSRPICAATAAETAPSTSGPGQKRTLSSSITSRMDFTVMSAEPRSVNSATWWPSPVSSSTAA
ncbi:MFS transporter [Kocuria coralli]|uniref:MFS transporter n=1 Tax=Kocuria coralli TaxID=1461025 RepID=A0A5J5L0D2_9MICC|nr:MFS transporter [Kocuria coralli]